MMTDAHNPGFLGLGTWSESAVKARKVGNVHSKPSLCDQSGFHFGISILSSTASQPGSSENEKKKKIVTDENQHFCKRLLINLILFRARRPFPGSEESGFN